MKNLEGGASVISADIISTNSINKEIAPIATCRT
jgi:hypothetical protein